MTAMSNKLKYQVNHMNPAARKAALGTRVQALENTVGAGVNLVTDVSGDVTFTTGPVSVIGAGKVVYSMLSTNNKKMIVEVPIPADTLAADEYEKTVYVAPFACTVSKIYVVPDVNFGQATNYKTLSVNNKTQTATLASKAFSSALGVAYTPGTLGTISNATLVADDVLTFKSVKTASGEALPRMVLHLEITRAA
jgi:hypothetical protein